jgi:WD40 repeat protein
VDPTIELLVATMLDKNAYVWDLEDPMPRAVYKGHNDIIKGVGYLQETKCFVTASWDK